jgi:hypothetical protein
MVMQGTLRPYMTAGVALLGSSLIAVTPVAATDIQQRAVQLSAVVGLLGAWVAYRATRDLR